MALQDIASGKKRALGTPGGSAASDGATKDFPPLIKLDMGEKLVGTFVSHAVRPSSYKKTDGSPSPDVNYYTFTVAADTGLTRPVKSDTGKIVGVEPVAVGDTVTMRGIGDLPEYMGEAEPGMLLEVESFGTKATNGGFNFSLFGVSVFEDDEA